MKQKFKLSKLEKSWILYDIGNSAFILLVASILPIYFSSLIEAANMTNDDYMIIWPFADLIPTAIVAVLAPILGVIADRGRNKKIMLTVTMLLGALGCAALSLAQTWLAFLILVIIAKLGFNASLIFYDSMLTEVTTPSRMDRISSLGYAWGYIGSVAPFLVCLGLVLGHDMLGMTMTTALVISFLLTGAWWIVLTLPLLSRYKKEKVNQRTAQNSVADTFRRLGRSFKEARQNKHIFVYLLAFFFFINGVYTIIGQATAYGEALDLDSTGLLLALLTTQIVAFPCSIIFGRLATKFRTGTMIKVGILCYTGIALFAMFLAELWQFWTLAVLVGMFQGGIQAVSRSYLGKIVPPERSGEYFGLMDIFGKGATILGSGLISFVTWLAVGVEIPVFGMTLNNKNLAVGSLVILFVIGYILFCYADRLNKKRGV